MGRQSGRVMAKVITKTYRVEELPPGMVAELDAAPDAALGLRALLAVRRFREVRIMTSTAYVRSAEGS
jgi:hypothetical protein